jgi:F-type H+-transporting ATPase subunit gamma
VPRPEVKKVCHIVVTADRGLCGAYNSSVIRAAEGSMREHGELGRDYSLVLLGRKGEGYFRYRNFRIDESFTGFSEQPSYEDARRVAAAVTRRFLSGEVDLVEIIYTRFVSVGSQEVVLRPIMPLEQEVVADGDGRPEPTEAGTAASYEFEPSPESILDRLLPRYVEARIFAALLNASASEQAARQRAMKSATDNAEDLITRLARIMNRARQDSITTEIMEIVSGAESMRTASHDLDVHDKLLATINNAGTTHG